ncbi:MAG: transcriptional regulator [Gammaproteobacteria bacterium RIFCSPHIGHO2_12_FULL_45_9]|nr:MAG: transcriptional regulator [Gammaproteobacteria bacterium RIFCSPHIGHO2_12_FULL_45_9]
MYTNKRNSKRRNQKALPVIPDKRYFSISEASVLCGVKAYVLRYWEQEFSQVKPNKRQGNRRFYQQEDILLIRQIKKLLYEDGFTIEGARAQLSSQHGEVDQTVKTDAMVKKIVADLEIILQNLKRTETVLS